MKLRQTYFKNHPALFEIKKQFNVKTHNCYYSSEHLWIENKIATGMLLYQDNILWLFADVKGCFDKWSKCPFQINLNDNYNYKLKQLKKCCSRKDSFNWSNNYDYYNDSPALLDSCTMISKSLLARISDSCCKTWTLSKHRNDPRESIDEYSTRNV